MSPIQNPKITFGLIVLNGEPFTRYCLRQIYPFAHEIIVVEGAAPAAKDIARADGHSRDGTLEVLRRFQKEEDPDDKLRLVTAEDDGHDNGFWPGEKDEMSQAYAGRVTGDWLWQVDIDEFYRAEDMGHICKTLVENPDISGMSFRQLCFWGRPDIRCDSVYLRARDQSEFFRLFKWGAGYRYATHRPPTVVNEQGQDLRSLRWLTARETQKMDVYLYHYSLLFPKQVREKCEYYASIGWDFAQESRQWAEENYFQLKNPFRVHNVYRYPGWLEFWKGGVPAQVLRMMDDIREGRIQAELRKTGDVEALLQSPWYRLSAWWLRFYCDRIYPWYDPLHRFVGQVGFRSHLRRWFGRDRSGKERG